MSEVMTRGIIGMPFEMAMGDDLSRRQFHSRAQGLLADYASLEQERERLRDLLKEIRPTIPRDVLELWCADRDAALSAKNEGVKP